MLSKVVQKEQLNKWEFLQEHLFIKQCIESKFQIHISTFAYEVLLTYMSTQKLTVIISIINDKIQFIQSNERSLNSHHLGVNRVELLDYTPKEVAGTLPPMQLGVPGKPTNNAASIPLNTLTSNLYKDWIKKLIEPRIFLGSSKLPGSPPSSEKGDLSAPSIIFATVFNSYGEVNCMHINADITRAICGFQDSIARVFLLGEGGEDREEHKLLDAFNSIDRRVTEVYPLAKNQKRSQFSAASSFVGGGNGGNVTGLYEDGNKAPELMSKPRSLELIGHSSPIFGVSQDAFNPRIALTCSADRTVRCWDVSLAQTVAKFTLLSAVWGVALGPLGHYFGTAARDGSVSVFGIDTARPVVMFLGHISDATTVQWHPNASLLISGSEDRTCRLLDMRTGKTARLLNGCPSSITSVAVSSNGVQAAAGCDSGASCVWDLGSGKLQHFLASHTSYVNSIAFSADDSSLITGSSDCSVKLWSLPSSATSATLSNASANNEMTLLPPAKSFGTKFTPVLYAGINSQNLIYAGGPFDVTTAPGLPVVFVSTETLHALTILVDRTSAAVLSEESAIKTLGIGQALPLKY